MLTVNRFSKLNGVESKPLTAGKNLMVNGLNMTSVRCPLNFNELKCF